MSHPLTFDQLPEAVDLLGKKLEKIERLLEERDQHTYEKPDQFLTIQQTANLLNLTVPTIYGLVHQLKIPYSKKGKRLYFLMSELELWIKSGRRKTIHEIESEPLSKMLKTRRGSSNEK